MSKSEIINSASEDENHGAKESGNSHDKNMPDLTKLQPYPVYKPFVSKESPKKTNQEKIIRFGRRQQQNWKYSLVLLW